jgi:hypothetical protein
MSTLLPSRDRAINDALLLLRLVRLTGEVHRCPAMASM